MPTSEPITTCLPAVSARQASGAGRRSPRIQAVATASARLGYEKGRDPRRLDTLIRPKEPVFGLLARAFEQADRRGSSLRKALDDATVRGLRSRHGKPLSVSAFWSVLTDPFYCGMVLVGGEWVAGTHEPVVSRPRFQRVQEHLASRRRSQGRRSGEAQVVQNLPDGSGETRQEKTGLQT